MSLIISFAYTTPALLAGRKSVTRREWTVKHGELFRGGLMCQAWDRSPRYGGKHVGDIQLERDASESSLFSMTDDDYEAEGFAYLHEHPEFWRKDGFGDFGRDKFDAWRLSGGHVWVVRFRLVRVLKGA